MASKARLFLDRLARMPVDGGETKPLALSYLFASLTVLAGLTAITTGVTLLVGGGFKLLNPLYIGGLVLLLFLVFDPVRKWWHHELERALSRETVDYRSLEGVFSAQLLQKTSPAEISLFIHQFLTETFYSKTIFVYVYDALTEHYRLSLPGNEVGSLRASEAVFFESSSSLAAALREKRQPFPIQELEQLDDADGARLALLGVQWIIPMHARGGLVGWIAMGKIQPPVTSSEARLTFLQLVGDHSAKALDRALAALKLERHIQQMRVLSRVAQGANFAITLDDLLELVYAQTSQVIPTTDFFVLLSDETTQSYAYAFYQVNGERESQREHHPLNITQLLEYEVIRTQNPISTRDYEGLCRSYGYLPVDKEILSWMAVPLNAGAQVIGVLSLGSRRAEEYFSTEQLNFLQAVADHVSGVIVKTRLLQETEKRAHQLATLNEISLSLTSTLQLEGLLEQMMLRVVELLQCELATLFFVDRTTGELTFEVVVGLAAEELINTRLPPGTGAAGSVAQTGEALLLNQASPQDHWISLLERKEGLQPRAILAVPLIYQQRVIGVIEVVNKRDGAPFTASERDILNALSAQASVAIENARLYTMTDQALASRVEELSVMQQIDRELNASLDVQHAMSITLDWALRQSKAEMGFIASVERDELHMIAAKGTESILDPHLSFPTLGEDWKALAGVQRALQTGQAQIVTHKNGEPYSSLLGNRGGAQVVLPIKRESEVLGILLLEGANGIWINDDTLAFLSRLCDHSAIAIANARLYAEVHEANLAKSKFVSFVAHELKNPMASIKGYTELMANGMAGPVTEMQAAFLETVRQNVDRMNNIVSDLNDLTKIQVGNLRLDFSATPLQGALAEVQRSLESQIRAKRQSLVVQVPPDVPPVWADAARLVQILTNLVSNAHKYTPEDGTISIGAENVPADAAAGQGASYVHIWVKDSGIGIDPQDQEKIFQPYFRSERAKDMASGTGLGLNITKSLVEMQGGRIWFESQAGEGTIFHFTLPSAEVHS